MALVIIINFTHAFRNEKKTKPRVKQMRQIIHSYESQIEEQIVAAIKTKPFCAVKSHSLFVYHIQIHLEVVLHYRSNLWIINEIASTQKKKKGNIAKNFKGGMWCWMIDTRKRFDGFKNRFFSSVKMEFRIIEKISAFQEEEEEEEAGKL